MQDLFNAFKFFSDHVHILGWLSLIVFALKVSWKLSRFFDGLAASFAKTEKMESTVELLATNHIPHLQIGIDKVDDTLQNLRSETIAELKGIRSDLFQVALRKE
jgi:hypothetical protein